MIATQEQVTQSKKARLDFQTKVAEACRIFQPTGITHHNTIPEGRSTILPEPSELGHRIRDGVVEIIRRQEGEDPVVLASAVENELDNMQELAETWLLGYAHASRPERAEMLDICDPMHMSEGLMQAILSQSRPSGEGKTKFTKPNEQGVQTGGTDKVKRLSWYGHSGFSLARYMGANGITGSEAVDIFQKLGLEMGKSAIIGGVYAGKSGKRGAPASVTSQQAKMINDLRSTQTKAKPQERATVKVKVEAPVAYSGKGSKARAKEAKLKAAMTARRKAGKK